MYRSARMFHRTLHLLLTHVGKSISVARTRQQLGGNRSNRVGCTAKGSGTNEGLSFGKTAQQPMGCWGRTVHSYFSNRSNNYQLYSVSNLPLL
jgi:hypothetical protein